MSNKISHSVYKWINKNFLIRVFPSSDLKKINSKLVGASRYHDIVGDKLFMKHFATLTDCKADKVSIRLRRGITIDFISR